MNKTQWWDYSKLKEFQLKRLKLLLTHAYENVPLYNKMFKEFNFDPHSLSNIDQLKVLPILTKEKIRKNLVDTRNILEHNKWEDYGFIVKILGKSDS